MPFINYTLDEKIALVALVPLIEKESKMEMFSGNGLGHLGNFTIKSKGFGDIKAGVLYKAYNSEDNKRNVIVGAVLSMPTGSITETEVQIPLVNTTPTTHLGYGAKYLATIPLKDKNSEGWRYGDKHELTAWGANLGFIIQITYRASRCNSWY